MRYTWHLVLLYPFEIFMSLFSLLYSTIFLDFAEILIRVLSLVAVLIPTLGGILLVVVVVLELNWMNMRQWESRVMSRGCRQWCIELLSVLRLS